MAHSAIELIAASASPLKPMVPTDSRSGRLLILLVAWRLRAIGSSSRRMPAPSSSTAISRTPPASSRTVTCVAPASSSLSTSSRTTEAGRSTTSPAAIWLISSSGSSRMGRRGRGVRTAFTGGILIFCGIGFCWVTQNHTTKRPRRAALLSPLWQALLPGLTLLIDRHCGAGGSCHLDAMLLAPKVVADIPILGLGLAGYVFATLDVLDGRLLSAAVAVDVGA